MIETLQNFNHILAIFAILITLGTLLVIIDLNTKRFLATYVREWGLVIAFFMTTVAMSISLTYSEVFGLIPCGLCWLQRVAMYPQVVLTATAIFIRDTKKMPVYGIALSIFGWIFGAYQHYLQMGGAEFIKCPASGGDCARRFLFEFDFVTLPLLATILFTFLITLYVYMLKVQKD